MRSLKWGFALALLSSAALAQTYPAPTFSAWKITGSSTGVTTFASANAGATNYTITFPAATGTVALTSQFGAALPSATASQLYVGSGAAGVAGVASTLPTGAVPAFTGDVTNSAGTLATTVGKIGGQTISLAAGFSTSGAFPIVFTATASTNVTLPTSGTLATTAGVTSSITSALATALPNLTTSQIYGGTGGAGVAQHFPAGTGVETALQVNVGLAGAFITFNGAAGTPSSINLSNATNLPPPTLTTLGGVEAIAAVSHTWINAISTGGVPSATQPAFTDISGSLAATQLPAFTGDVTSPSGSSVNTIAANAVTNAKAAQMAARTIKGNNTGGQANALDLTVAQVSSLIGLTELNANTYTGVDPTGVTDSTAGLQAVINALPATGGTVNLCGTYKISSPGLVIGNGSASALSTIFGVKLKGCGAPNVAMYDAWTGYAAGSPTVLSYVSASGFAIGVEGPLRGWGVENLLIDCNSGATTSGLYNASGSFGRASNVSIRNCSTGINSTAVGYTGAALVTSATTFNNFYDHITIDVPNIAGAKGLYLDGFYQASGSVGATTCPCLADTDANIFDNVYVLMGSATNAQYAAYIRTADTNTFHGFYVLMNQAGGGYGIIMDYSNDPSLPANNSFYSSLVSSSVGGAITHTLANTGTPSALAITSNWIDRPSLVNGDTWASVQNTIVNSPVAQSPTISSGCGGGSPSISAPNGPYAFDVTIGTASGTTCVLAMPTAPAGFTAWNCVANDITTHTAANASVIQTARSGTAVTMTDYSDIMGAATWVSGDHLAFQCAAY